MPDSWNATCPRPPTPMTWRSTPPHRRIFSAYPERISFRIQERYFDRAVLLMAMDFPASAPLYSQSPGCLFSSPTSVFWSTSDPRGTFVSTNFLFRWPKSSWIMKKQ